MTRPVIVALHGVGANADDLAAALQPLSSATEVIALPGHEAFMGSPRGRQWFSVNGVTEANRPARVAAALPALLAQLDRIAAQRGIGRDELVLLGFSQGAIMTLAAVAGGHYRGLAIAIAGRLASPVVPARPGSAGILLIHDAQDRVMPANLAVEAAASLTAAGHHVDIARTSGIGHSIGEDTLAAISGWLADRAQPAPASFSLQG